jgi:hypothetical protein
MANELKKSDEENQTDRPTPTFSRVTPASSTHSEPVVHRTKLTEQSDDRSAVRLTAVATVWMAIFTLVLTAVNGGTLLILHEQLKEMHEGGIDTHNLAVAAGNQAKATQNLVAFAEIQSDRTEELAQTTRDALVEVQRAVMSVEHVNLTRELSDGKVDHFFFTVRWKNSGTSPTKNFTMHNSWIANPSSLPNDFGYPDLWSPGEPHVSTPAFVSPQAFFDTVATEVPSDIVQKVQNHQLRLVFYGWARYQDVFKKTQIHTTEYCSEVVGFHHNPFDLASEAIGLMTRNCSTHNCHDEECTAP